MLFDSKYFILVPRAALSRIPDLHPRRGKGERKRERKKKEKERKKYAAEEIRRLEKPISPAPRSRGSVFLRHTTPESLVVDVGALLGP